MTISPGVKVDSEPAPEPREPHRQPARFLDRLGGLLYEREVAFEDAPPPSIRIDDRMTFEYAGAQEGVLVYLERV